MISFKRLDLSRRQEVFDWFNQAGRLGCEYSFVNLFLWGRQHAAFVEGYLVVFSHFFGHSMYLFPSGHGPMKPVLEALQADAREREIPFRMTSMSLADCRAVEELYPACQNLLDKWYRTRLEADPHLNYHLEQLAMDRAFQHYEALGLDGLILFAGDKPIAITMGSLLSPGVYDVHFEKALGEIPGDYAMINREFARYIREAYPQVQYLDREDDMGLPGLRKAKESYHPDRMIEQYWCVLKEEIDAP